jgi:ankyrin repeat protein
MDIVRAIAGGDTDVAQILVGEWKQEETDNELPLQKAIEANDLKLVKALLTSHTVNSQNKKGQTPLHASIVAGNEEAFNLLISSPTKGSLILDVFITDNSGKSPFFYTCFYDRTEMARKMLSMVNHIINDGPFFKADSLFIFLPLDFLNTPLQKVCITGNLQLFNLFPTPHDTRANTNGWTVLPAVL